MKLQSSLKCGRTPRLSLLLYAVFFAAVMGERVPYDPGPCDKKLNESAWCDRSKSFETRAKALVANLSIAEKTGLFRNGMAPIPRIDVPAYGWFDLLIKCR